MRLKDLLVEERGQDLSEYSLLIVFVLLAVIGLAAGYNNNIIGIVSVSNNNLSAANMAAS